MFGLSPKLPLSYDSVDGPYRMIKDYQTMLMQNLKMLMLTNKGERVMDSEFGVGLRNYLFSNDFVTMRVKLENEISNQVAIYLPMITLELIEINQNLDFEEKIDVNIFYSVPQINIQDTLSLSINSAT